jgi:hypothetical protein
MAHPFTMLVLNTRYSQVHTQALRERTRLGKTAEKVFLRMQGYAGEYDTAVMNRR